MFWAAARGLLYSCRRLPGSDQATALWDSEQLAGNPESSRVVDSCYPIAKCAKAVGSRILASGAGFPLIQAPGNDFRLGESVSPGRPLIDSLSFLLLLRQPPSPISCTPGCRLPGKCS